MEEVAGQQPGLLALRQQVLEQQVQVPEEQEEAVPHIAVEQAEQSTAVVEVEPFWELQAPGHMQEVHIAAHHTGP